MPVDILDGIDSIPGTDNPDNLVPAPAPTPEAPAAAAPTPADPKAPVPDPNVAKPEPKAAEPVKDPNATVPSLDLPTKKKAVDAPKPAEPVKPAEPAEPKNWADMRKTYQETKAERDALKQERDSIKKEYEEFKAKGFEEASKPIKETLAQREKRIAELEERHKLLDFRSSEEYKEKYHAPLEKTWKTAIEEISDAEFPSKDEEGNDIVVKLKPEEAAHYLDKLTKMTGVQASNMATRWFGQSAGFAIMSHRNEIVAKTQAAQNAVSEYQTKGSEFQQQKQRETQEMSQRALNTFNSQIEARSKEMPELFAEDPQDQEGNDALKTGRLIYEVAFMGKHVPAGMTPQAKQELITKYQGEVAARAMAHPREVIRRQRLEEQVEKLKAELKSYKNEPVPKPRITNGETKPRERDIFAGIDAIGGGE
jgi:hypothetical protein